MLQGAVQSVQGAIGDTVGAVHLAAVQTAGVAQGALPLGSSAAGQR